MKVTLASLSKSIKHVAVHYSPEILTGMGIVGMVSSVVMAVNATPKALEILHEERIALIREAERKGGNCAADLTKKEIVSLTWKCYIPTAVTVLMSGACIIGASSINTSRNAALLAAYTMSESAMREYQSKVVDIIGKEKNRELKDEIIQDRVDRKPITNQELVIFGEGEILCYDVSSDRYFKSSANKLESIKNEINRRMRSEYVSLNEYYYEIGLKGTDLGETHGWNIDRGYVDLYYSAILKDGTTPCLAVDFNNEPQTGFQDYS